MLDTEISKEDADVLIAGQSEIELAIEFYRKRGVPWVDISGFGITTIPSSVWSFNTLTYLNVSSNNLENLPDNIFENFPLLTWLDVRFNKIKFLPTVGMNSHDRLKVLLLQGNLIKTLPLELGYIESLNDIQFDGNPIEFPPAEILAQGTSMIKDFLAAVLHANGGVPKISGEKGTMRDNEVEFEERPTVRIKPISSSAGTQHASKPNKNAIPSKYSGLPSAEALNIKAKEQNQREAKKKKNIKIDKALQKRRDFQSLDDWRDEAKALQRKKEMEKRLNGGHLDFDEAARVAPFGTEEGHLRMKSDAERRRNLSPRSQKPKPLSPETLEKMEKLQIEKDNELSSMIKQHMNRVVSRSKNRGREEPAEMGATAFEDLNLAKHELEIAQRLQQEVSRRRKEMEFRMNTLQQRVVGK